MPNRLQYSTSLTADEVLDRLRANSSDPADVLKSLQNPWARFPFCLGKHEQPVVVEIEGRRFQLRFQGGRVGPNPSRQHVDGFVEATSDGSRVDVEPKDFFRNETSNLLLCCASIAMGIMFGAMLKEDLPGLAVTTFIIFSGYGMLVILVVLRRIANQRKLLLELLSRSLEP